MINNRKILHKASRDFAHQTKYHRWSSFISYQALAKHMADAEDTSPIVDNNDAPDVNAAVATSEGEGPHRVLLTGGTGLIICTSIFGDTKYK